MEDGNTVPEGGESPVEAPKRVGRPTKGEVEAKKPGGRGKVGRPKGDAAIMNEYKARMLASPKSQKVLAKVFDVALDDNHKNQAACMKMVMDRIAPVGVFEQDIKKAGHGSGIQITITGVQEVQVGESKEEEPIEADYEEVTTEIQEVTE